MFDGGGRGVLAAAHDLFHATAPVVAAETAGIRIHRTRISRRAQDVIARSGMGRLGWGAAPTAHHPDTEAFPGWTAVARVGAYRSFDSPKRANLTDAGL